jgi:hypothetical protein
MITAFAMRRDVSGLNGFGLPVSNTKYSALLASGVEQILTAPVSTDSNLPFVLGVFSFEIGADVWVSLNSPAVIPNGNFTFTNSELNPAARLYKPGDQIRLITSETTAQVGIVFYALPRG